MHSGSHAQRRCASNDPAGAAARQAELPLPLIAATAGALARPLGGSSLGGRGGSGGDGDGRDGGSGGRRPKTPATTPVRTYYVRVILTGLGGEQRRGTVEVDGALLRALADVIGTARGARSWIKTLVEQLCQEYPQDLGLGSARWKTTTGLSLKDYVERAMRNAIARGVAPGSTP